MKNKITVSVVASLLVAVVGIFAAQDAAAQGPVYYDANGRMIPAPYPNGVHPHHIGGQPQYLGYPTPIVPMHRPQYPVLVSPNEISGVNPWTGGLNTRNGQVDNTYFDFGRNGSQYNGSKRWVNRPIYDSYGNVTGHSQGYVWNNSLTGQEHGNVRDVTGNGLGGDHETVRMYSKIVPSQQGK